MKQKTDDEFRAHFWSKIEKRGEDECWPWLAAVTKCGGYGQIERNHKGMRANRLAYEFTYGKFDGHLFVLHRCDNPKCCNPKHLFLGTAKDNSDDCRKKCRDRKALGSRNANSKLTEDAVVAIRQRYATENITTTELGKVYGVTSSQISNAVRRVSWMHVP